MALELVAPPSALDRIGFEIGWDHGRFGLVPGLVPDLPQAGDDSPLQHGLRASRATFGARRLAPTRHVQRWLQLRLAAWRDERSVETVQVTPNYLAQIEAAHCPITREPLAAEATSITRVRADAGYAAGNLAAMSPRAEQAKAGHGHPALLALAARAGAQGRVDGLTEAEWQRLAVLSSFVEPLPHDQACALALRVLPPNRLRLFNPAQALQAFLSRQLLAEGWSRRLRRIAALLPATASRRALLELFAALLPRFIEAGRDLPAHAARWAVEDAWADPLLQKRWLAFALALGAAGCETLLTRASARGLGTQAVWQLADAAATEGWALASRGRVPRPDPDPRGAAVAALPAAAAWVAPARTPRRALASAHPLQACLPL